MTRRKLTIIKDRKPKKERPKLEIVEHCDCCGGSLGRTCVRTVPSAVCAAGAGTGLRYVIRDTVVNFYCGECSR